MTKGANAVFGVTNFFEYMMEKGALAAAEKETQQLVNIATAASKISTLEHLVLHTLPSGEKLGGKDYYVPHMDVRYDPDSHRTIHRADQHPGQRQSCRPHQSRTT